MVHGGEERVVQGRHAYLIIDQMGSDISSANATSQGNAETLRFWF